MQEKQFGFGIVGTGTIAGIHALAIQAIVNAKLHGVYSLNKNKSQVFADSHNCISYDTLDDMLHNDSIDVVCICTPSGVHLEPALQCIAAKRHCVIEKPLEVTLDRCDQIISAASKAGVKLAVIFPSRFNQASKQVKQAVEEKRFGNLVLGDAYVKWNRTEAYYASAEWRGTWKLDGGGALMNQGIHSVDLLQWYMGPVKSVQAVSANIKHTGIEVEDTIVCLLQFANGALGTIECSTAVFPGALKRIEVLGTAGTAVIEESKLIKWQFNTSPLEEESIDDTMPQHKVAGGVSNPADISFAGHKSQLEDMLLAIETGKTPLVDGTEGRKSVEIVLAIYESARTGNKVNFV